MPYPLSVTPDLIRGPAYFAEPQTARVAHKRRRSRRKRDRAPRLIARKPRWTDVHRPAPEGENKQTRGATAPSSVIPAKAGVFATQELSRRLR